MPDYGEASPRAWYGPRDDKRCSVQAKLETTKDQKLEAEGTAAGLATDLTKVRDLL